MSVPPASRRPSSTPPSRGRPDETREKGEKDFKLPAKKQHVKESDEEAKKKGLFDIAGKEALLQDKQQRLAQEVKAEAATVGEVTSTEAVAQVRQVDQLIQKMVESMRVGQIDGQDYASLELKKSAEVPEAFAGSNLTVSYHDNGIVIRFDNFMTPQQQNTAITLVEQNKEQLQQMVQTLNAKNIQVNELTIGEHTVALPKVAPLPPPFQPQPATQAETEQQRERGGREGGEQRGGEGGGPRK
jgi:Family of unknown function (DUF5421)